ncbi:hypothetical protein SDC9_54887 [bioreactor metagenome]|uniref:Uncharacterized protein n=1 Tax=bioreactor metagenome TaxID=1076179 RepID=A0A644X367_9ZZZZ
MIIQHLLQTLEEVGRRHHVAARALDGLHIEGRVFTLVGLGVPDRVVFVLELARKVAHDLLGILLGCHALGAAERVGEGNELRAFAKVAEAAAIAVARCDRRRAQCAAVVAALEREHQALAVAGVAHHLERILDGLRAAHVEVHAALFAPLLLGVLRDELRQLDLGGVQILTGHLRQLLELLDHSVFQPLVLVAEVDGRVPHLQIQIRRASVVIHVAAFAAGENLGGIDVMDGVAKRAVLGFVGQELSGIEGHSKRAPERTVAVWLRNLVGLSSFFGEFVET